MLHKKITLMLTPKINLSVLDVLGAAEYIRYLASLWPYFLIIPNTIDILKV